ncbi:MAG: putative polyphosphate/ATP-dependent NAD kinase [Candidatus Azotimanducaceae bacterium]|jgi:predicted polyphosphate/ATP-dependent NAD kinase
MKRLKIGLVINPLAGIGGPTGLKGSDGGETVNQAFSRGGSRQIDDRVEIVLNALYPYADKIELHTVPGSMGLDLCEKVGWIARVHEMTIPKETKALHTSEAVSLLQAANLDLLLFAGGDGTARDVLKVLKDSQTILGIPGGVKMHSGVFSNNPMSAARIVIKMVDGELLNLMRAEVRDIDEDAFRQGVVRSQFFGECWVPEEMQHIQAVKAGGLQIDELIIEDIAAAVIEEMKPDDYYLIGSGTTTAVVMNQLSLENTLLGVDLICNRKLVFSDAYEKQLFEFCSDHQDKVNFKILITAIGGQGHIFGRGNQQLSPRLLRVIGIENIEIIASEEKLSALNNQLQVDTGDKELDESLAGYRRVRTGFESTVLCKVLN